MPLEFADVPPSTGPAVVEGAEMVEGCPVVPDAFARFVALDADALSHASLYLDMARSAGPVVWIPGLDTYAVTDYERAVEVLTDPDRFSSELGDPKGPRAVRKLVEARNELAARSSEFAEVVARLNPDWRQVNLLSTKDPPGHTRHRKMVNKLFLPRRVDALRPRVAALANELIDRFAGRGETDIVPALAVPIPMQVIAEQLGVPTADLADFKRWSDDLVFVVGNDSPTADDIMRITRTLVEFDEYFRALLAAHRGADDGTFISLVANAEDENGPFSDEERIGMVAQLLGAGNETATKMIASAVDILGTDVDLASTLREQPELIEPFIEEVLRTRSPVQGLYRVARRDTQLAGVSIPAGASIWVLYAAANRTEDVFRDSSTIDLHRDNPRNHLAFGRGTHYCVGAPLARLEGAESVRALLERFQGWTVLEREPDASYILHGPRTLRIELQLRSTATAPS